MYLYFSLFAVGVGLFVLLYSTDFKALILIFNIFMASSAGLYVFKSVDN